MTHYVQLNFQGWELSWGHLLSALKLSHPQPTLASTLFSMKERKRKRQRNREREKEREREREREKERVRERE